MTTNIASVCAAEEKLCHEFQDGLELKDRQRCLDMDLEAALTAAQLVVRNLRFVLLATVPSLCAG
jgi:hypothetical protein